MTKATVNSQLSKSKGQVILEHVLLVVCLCVIALRATFTEGSTIRTLILPDNLGEIVYSISISGLLIFSCVLWFVWGFCSSRFSYRVTGIEIGLAVFCIAAVISGLAATDKRLAIIDATMLAGPVLMAMLLVQILDSPLRIRLALAVIGALGVVSAYQCAEQFFVSNQMTIEQYEQDPQAVLEPSVKVARSAMTQARLW